jgi:hypothetical protein
MATGAAERESSPISASGQTGAGNGARPPFIAKHGRNPKIDNLVGLMIRGAVAKYFEPPASELTRYRAGKQREREKQEQIARDYLNDPNSTEAEREWARSRLLPTEGV